MRLIDNPTDNYCAPNCSKLELLVPLSRHVYSGKKSWIDKSRYSIKKVKRITIIVCHALKEIKVDESERTREPRVARRNVMRGRTHFSRSFEDFDLSWRVIWIFVDWTGTSTFVYRLCTAPALTSPVTTLPRGILGQHGKFESCGCTETLNLGGCHKLDRESTVAYKYLLPQVVYLRAIASVARAAIGKCYLGSIVGEIEEPGNSIRGSAWRLRRPRLHYLLK